MLIRYFPCLLAWTSKYAVKAVKREMKLYMQLGGAVTAMEILSVFTLINPKHRTLPSVLLADSILICKEIIYHYPPFKDWFLLSAKSSNFFISNWSFHIWAQHQRVHKIIRCKAKAWAEFIMHARETFLLELYTRWFLDGCFASRQKENLYLLYIIICNAVSVKGREKNKIISKLQYKMLSRYYSAHGLCLLVPICMW